MWPMVVAVVTHDETPYHEDTNNAHCMSTARESLGERGHDDDHQLDTIYAPS